MVNILCSFARPEVHSTALGLAIAEKAGSPFFFEATSLTSVAAGLGWKTCLAFPICLGLCGTSGFHFDVTFLGLLVSLHLRIESMSTM